MATDSVSDFTRNVASQAIQATPAIAGSVASALTLNQWIAIGTAIYLIVQVAYLLRKWYREERDWYPRKRR